MNSYVTLGRSGLRVSPLCLGTMTFGYDWGWGTSPETASSILAHYLDTGGNFIDTANVYTRGHAEKIIGDYFAASPSRRQRAVIGTKFFCNLFAGDPNGGGAGRKAIIAQCNESLRRLQTDYIDLYWLHNWDKYTPVEETLQTLDGLVQAGKVRYIGFSDVPAWKVAQAQTMSVLRGWAPLIGIQVEYSLLQRTVEGELLPMAHEFKLGVTTWGPLRQGALSGKYRPDDANPVKSDRGRAFAPIKPSEYAILEEVRRVATQGHVSASVVSLAWLLRRPGVSSVILGVRSEAQLIENLKALEFQLTPSDAGALDKLSVPTLPFPAQFDAISPHLAHAGATVNGDVTRASKLIPQRDTEGY